MLLRKRTSRQAVRAIKPQRRHRIGIKAEMSSPSPRDEIVDALYRAVLGLDLNDLSLFTSAFSPDASTTFSMTFPNGQNVTHASVATIIQEIFEGIGPLDTTHFLTNVRVHGPTAGAGGARARVSSSALAQHFRPREGGNVSLEGRTNLMSGSLYDVELKEEDGLWRITNWAMRVIWLEGDMGVLSSGHSQQ